MFVTLASVTPKDCSILVRFITVILGATIPARRLVKHINLYIMGIELCEECSYLTSDFSRGDLKEPLNYSFTCQSGKKKERKKKNSPCIFYVCSDCFGCGIKEVNAKINLAVQVQVRYLPAGRLANKQLTASV